MTVKEDKTVNDFYPSPWLKAADLPGDKVTWQIIDVNEEPIGEKMEDKLVLYFNESEKSLILNKTNATSMSDLFGPGPNEWIGRWVKLYIEPVRFMGKTSMAIRIWPEKVEAPENGSQAMPPEPEAPPADY